MNLWSLEVWLHVLAGITWIGLLYYFNFIQVPAVAAATNDTNGPGVALVSLVRSCHMDNRCARFGDHGRRLCERVCTRIRQ
jgi:hypothetical protein